MVKSYKSQGFKWIMFTGSLIILLLSTLVMTTNVFASCDELREFNCTINEICSGEIVLVTEECVNLCMYDTTAYLSSASFYFQLRFLDSKNLLGTDANYPVGGCSVNFKGRSTMIIDYMPLVGATGCKYHFKCTPCDGCCPG